MKKKDKQDELFMCRRNQCIQKDIWKRDRPIDQMTSSIYKTHTHAYGCVFKKIIWSTGLLVY